MRGSFLTYRKGRGCLMWEGSLSHLAKEALTIVVVSAH